MGRVTKEVTPGRRQDGEFSLTDGQELDKRK